MMYGGISGFGMFGFGLISMILFWGLVIVGITLLVKWIIKQYRVDRFYIEESPLEILKKRYARGEINKEEFEERKRELLE